MKKVILFLCIATLVCKGYPVGIVTANKNLGVATMTTYHFPAENEKHEGTWLNWPHHYTYGMAYREELEGIWVEMAYALHQGENVHIIAYNEAEKQRISELLTSEKLDMSKIDFVIAKSDDVWSRDTGPIFVRDENGGIRIANFQFDGWGKKTSYGNDKLIPVAAANAKGIPILDIQTLVLEGGAVELDGSGTLMACKSSVINKNRNPGMTVTQVEWFFNRYFGATNFIWLDGVVGADITDAHIDGTARFFNDTVLLTVSKNDFLEMYEGAKESDYEILLSAKNSQGQPYEIKVLPLSAQNVQGLKERGSYLNYYVGNEVVLLPIYHDQNDKAAIEMMEDLYEDREIVPIDVTALYQYGGMLHCVTQQQPV